MSSELSYHPGSEKKTEHQPRQNGIGRTNGEIAEHIKTGYGRVQRIQQMIEHEAPFQDMPRVAVVISYRLLWSGCSVLPGQRRAVAAVGNPNACKAARATCRSSKGKRSRPTI